MGMNENEGSSAYPSNPDVKSGSCLIAGFHALTDIRPSYWNAYKAESGATFSIDMVRLKLSFINGKGEWLSTHAQTFDCDSMSAWTSKIQSLNDVLRDAQRATDAWNRDHAAPQRTYRGRAR